MTKLFWQSNRELLRTEWSRKVSSWPPEHRTRHRPGQSPLDSWGVQRPLCAPGWHHSRSRSQDLDYVSFVSWFHDFVCCLLEWVPLVVAGSEEWQRAHVTAQYADGQQTIQSYLVIKWIKRICLPSEAARALYFHVADWCLPCAMVRSLLTLTLCLGLSWSQWSLWTDWTACPACSPSPAGEQESSRSR